MQFRALMQSIRAQGRVQRIFVLEDKVVGKSWKILIQVHDYKVDCWNIMATYCEKVTKSLHYD